MMTLRTMRLAGAVAGLLYAAPADAAGAGAGGNCSPTVSTFPEKTSHYRQLFVSVAEAVRLEVLDWGGTGRPLVLLAGLGNTAHVFDTVAPELARHFHVYGITRRGFGASSVPETGYTPDRLGEDVVAVLDALGIKRPILAGHSIAGEELSAIGTRFPDRVAGLVYLDAAHGYAIYDPRRGAYLPDLERLGTRIAHMHGAALDTPKMAALLDDVTILRQSLASELDAIGTDDASTVGAVQAEPGDAGMASFAAFRCFVSLQVGGMIPEDEIRQTFAATASGGVGKQKSPSFVRDAILEGEDRLHAPVVPILAIVPVPRASDLPAGDDPAKRLASEALHTRMQEAEIGTLLHQQPSAKIVRIRYGHHYVFLSNQSEVVSVITEFGEALR